jgi:cytochrome P450
LVVCAHDDRCLVARLLRSVQRGDVDDPSLIPGAVEELLRYEAPSPVNGRWMLRPYRAHGVEIPAGSKVLLLNGSANRDRREFDDPDRFDVRRVIKRHISFGYGAHFCLGAALARLEARVALAGTLARFPRWDIDPSELVPVQTSTVRGFSSVPIHLSYIR